MTKSQPGRFAVRVAVVSRGRAPGRLDHRLGEDDPSMRMGFARATTPAGARLAGARWDPLAVPLAGTEDGKPLLQSGRSALGTDGPFPLR